MRSPTLQSALLTAALLRPGLALAADGGAPPPAIESAAEAAGTATPSPWLGEQLPLPLAVKTPQDLALKAVAERQYLIFNLLARGKLAWDGGDFAVAAAKWEELLRIPNLDPELDRVLKPMAVEARARASSAAAAAPSAESTAARRPAPTSAVVPMVSISGEVSVADGRGPDGAIVWLRRVDGPTPRPGVTRGRTMVVASKSLSPKVLPVTAGSTVTFTNKDSVVHNLFSLSTSLAFDGGLSKTGQSFSRTFVRPGVAEILCNIHASEQAHVVVLDSPWYAEASSRGAFTVRGLPPGDYDLEAFHPSAGQPGRMRVRVGNDGLRGVAVKLGGERRATTGQAAPTRP